MSENTITPNSEIPKERSSVQSSHAQIPNEEPSNEESSHKEEDNNMDDRNVGICGNVIVGKSHVFLCNFCWKHPSPFSNVHFRNTTKIAAQILALNFVIGFTFSTMSLSCIFVFAPYFNCMDLSIMQKQHP